MSDRVFFDTTILIYALSEGDPRAAAAENLLNSGGLISVQVLNEFVSVARRKLGMPWDDVVEALSAIRMLCEPPVPLAVEVHESALQIAQRYEFNIYDALILAAALEGGCTVLYSEDIKDSQRIDSLTIRNPFLNHREGSS